MLARTRAPLVCPNETEFSRSNGAFMTTMTEMDEVETHRRASGPRDVQPDEAFRQDDRRQRGRLLVPRGCAFGYLGPNGAGKTTLIRVLLGLTHADAGTMRLLGYDVPRHRDKALARVGAIVDEPRFHGHLTGRQNLQILAAAREPAARERIDQSLDRAGNFAPRERQGLEILLGMRQRLGVAACLIGDPQLRNSSTSRCTASTRQACTRCAT